MSQEKLLSLGGITTIAEQTSKLADAFGSARLPVLLGGTSDVAKLTGFDAYKFNPCLSLATNHMDESFKHFRGIGALWEQQKEMVDRLRPTALIAEKFSDIGGWHNAITNFGASNQLIVDQFAKQISGNHAFSLTRQQKLNVMDWGDCGAAFKSQIEISRNNVANIDAWISGLSPKINSGSNPAIDSFMNSIADFKDNFDIGQAAKLSGEPHSFDFFAADFSKGLELSPALQRFSDRCSLHEASLKNIEEQIIEIQELFGIPTYEVRAILKCVKNKIRICKTVIEGHWNRCITDWHDGDRAEEIYNDVASLQSTLNSMTKDLDYVFSTF